MKISTDIPPIYETLHEKFGANWDDFILITVGDTVYTKDIGIIRDDLIIHEKVHEVQQRKEGPAIWWKKWIDDPVFRFEQEKSAYQVQLIWLKKNIKNREDRAKYVHSMAKNLSSSFYGNLISMQNALELLH